MSKQNKLQNFIKDIFSFDWQKYNHVNPLIRKMSAYYLLNPNKRKKFENEIHFLNHKSTKDNMHSYVFPYDFVKKYNEKDINVFFDNEKKMFYVMHFNKKLFFKDDFKTAEEVQKIYNTLLIEQDKESAHCYLNEDFKVDNGDVVLDVGAAEGNFSLEIIEKVKKIYIFETDPNWIKALEYTFEPWKEKVEIINKFVSNNNIDNNTTLKDYFNNNEINFIKLDVEGEEINILNNSIDYLKKQKKLKLAICTYHNNNDALIISDILNENNIKFSFSKNYMLFIYNKLNPPYFRKGLIRAIIN